MRTKNFFGITVLDKNVKEIGRIDDVEINTETGKVDSLVISLKKGIFSNDEIEVDFESIATIGDYILLNTEIETEEVEEVTIEVEDDEE